MGDDRVGTAVHEVLEGLFGPWAGSELQARDLRASLQDVPLRVERAMERTAPGRSLAEGQPMLQAAMAAAAIRHYLEAEALRIDRGAHVVVEAVEHPVRVPFTMRGDGPERVVTIGGKIDRVERRNGHVHIVDVKTGSVKPGDLSVRDLAHIGRGKAIAVQLLIYCWAWLRSHPDTEAVTAGVVPLRRPAAMDRAGLRIGGRERVGQEDLPAIEALIGSVITRLLDPSIPFHHDPESRFCAFCLDGK